MNLDFERCINGQEGRHKMQRTLKIVSHIIRSAKSMVAFKLHYFGMWEVAK